MDDKTTFVMISDENYFHKAKRTIMDLRSKGEWTGDLVLITINFKISQNFKDFYNITTVDFPEISKTEMLEKIKNKFSDGDGREFDKINQWEKLHVFDSYFLNWDRIVYIDCGLRILDSVKYLLELDYKNCILAPNDAGHTNRKDKVFKTQLSFDNLDLIQDLQIDFGDAIMESQYFLNCIWVYDTNILKICDKNELIEAMNKYPICKTNEMTIMNLLFHYKYKLWKEFPIKNSNGKFLFEWCESNHDNNPNWTEFCYIKYPRTITFDY